MCTKLGGKSASCNIISAVASAPASTIRTEAWFPRSPSGMSSIASCSPCVVSALLRSEGAASSWQRVVVTEDDDDTGGTSTTRIVHYFLVATGSHASCASTGNFIQRLCRNRFQIPLNDVSVPFFDCLLVPVNELLRLTTTMTSALGGDSQCFDAPEGVPQKRGFPFDVARQR